MTEAETGPDNSVAAGNRKRNILLVLITFIFLVGGALYAARWWYHGKFYESTDDAYVAGLLVDIEPQVSGTVVAINCDNTDFVQKGQVLVRLDDTDAAIALEKAKVQLAQSVHEVKGNLKQVDAAGSAIQLKEADLKKAQDDYNRRKVLYEKKAITDEVYDHAKIALNSAQEALNVAKHLYAEAVEQAETDNVEKNSRVKLEKEKVREAYISYRRTLIAAPVSGFVAKRSVQLGERVGPGKPLMVVIPLERVWVEANFKENQLAGMRIDQPVIIESDMYGKAVTFHGTVAGIGAGTGAVFSIIPPQNATGNWIKVVQRVPVKILLNSREIAQNPLLVGLSVTVVVDKHDQRGASLSSLKGDREIYKTDVYETAKAGEEEIIKQIIHDNLTVVSPKAR